MCTYTKLDRLLLTGYVLRFSLKDEIEFALSTLLGWLLQTGRLNYGQNVWLICEMKSVKVDLSGTANQGDYVWFLNEGKIYKKNSYYQHF